MNYFTESTGWISYVTPVSQPRHYPRSGQAAAWNDAKGTAGDQGPNEADHACLCATGMTQPPAEPRGQLRVLSASSNRVAGWEGGSGCATPVRGAGLIDSTCLG